MGAGNDGETTWDLRHSDGRRARVKVPPRLRRDDHDTLRAAAIAGLGIVALPVHLCAAQIEKGQFLHLLPDWSAHADAAATLLAPTRRGQQPSVRAFIDFMVEAYPRAIHQGK